MKPSDIASKAHPYSRVTFNYKLKTTKRLSSDCLKTGYVALNQKCPNGDTLRVFNQEFGHIDVPAKSVVSIRSVKYNG